MKGGSKVMVAFEKEVIERLARIEEQNKTQFKRIKALDQTINGNGRNGILARIQAIEAGQASQSRSSSKFLTIAGWIVTTLVALYGAMRK